MPFEDTWPEMNQETRRHEIRDIYSNAYRANDHESDLDSDSDDEDDGAIDQNNDNGDEVEETNEEDEETV